MVFTTTKNGSPARRAAVGASARPRAGGRGAPGKYSGRVAAAARLELGLRLRALRALRALRLPGLVLPADLLVPRAEARGVFLPVRGQPPHRCPPVGRAGKGSHPREVLLLRGREVR